MYNSESKIGNCAPTPTATAQNMMLGLISELATAINDSENLTMRLNEIKNKVVGNEPSGGVDNVKEPQPISFKDGIQYCINRVRRNNEYLHSIVQKIDVF